MCTLEQIGSISKITIIYEGTPRKKLGYALIFMSKDAQKGFRETFEPGKKWKTLNKPQQGSGFFSNSTFASFVFI